MVFLWPILSETLVDRSIEIKYPIEMKKNSEPEAPWSILRVFSISGNSGEKITLEMKFKKKTEVRNRRLGRA
jgi:hypothetical protein